MVSEKRYHRLVRSWLADSFADVVHEPELRSGLEPDFLAHTPFGSYVIEVENTWNLSDIYNGLGQLEVYLAEIQADPAVFAVQGGVLVVPADEVDADDARYDALVAADHTPHIETV